MPLTQFQNLDFEDIKAQIKDYLRANSNFTDFDFEGSNMSVLIDPLAYNSYITAYNSNMVANEVFIDSATLRENVAALARNIGYTPRSKKSSKAIVSFFVDTSSYAVQHEKMLREIVADNLTPKKRKINTNLAENDLFDAESEDGELWNPDLVV